MLEILVLIFIICMSSLLGLVIWHNNPSSWTNRLFTLSAISIIFWSIIMYLSVNTPSLEWTLFYIRLSMLAGTIMAISFLLLSSSFPYPTLGIKQPYLSLLLIAGVITSIVAMSPYMFTHLVVEGSNIEPSPGWGIVTFMLTSLGSNIATFIVLIRKFIKSQGLIKEQLKFVVVGTLVMFALLISGNFFAVIVLKTSSFIFLAPLFTLTFLGSVAYAILRHKMLDIRALVARTVSYTILLSIVVVLEAILVYLGTRLLPTSIDRSFIAVAGSVLIVMGYSQLSASITHLTEKIFFQGRYDTEDLLKSLITIMVSEVKIDVLTHKLLTTLTVGMRVSSAAFVILKDQAVRSIEMVGFAKDKLPFSASELEWLLHVSDEPLIFEELTKDSDKEYFRNNSLSVIIPLSIKDERVGYLLLGPKSSGEIYLPRDYELLGIFAPQAAIAIKNAESYREIQEFNATLSGKVAERTRQLEESQAAELKLKDEFVFIATHDLATPVTSIAGFSAIIKKRGDKLPPALRADLDAIGEASNRLKVLVNDLLQVARSDSGTIKVDLVKVDLGEILTAAVKQAQPMAAEKQVTVKLNLAADNTIQADPKKLAEIVENLISNGIKYNKEGGSLTITTTTKDNHLVAEFSDTGLGIDAKEQAKVFTKFFRSEEAVIRQRPGTGLGLFVVRMLTEKMGGKISFKSVEGQGTTFWLEFSK